MSTHIQVELGILLASMARELRCSAEEVPLELEVVARASLEAAHAKGRALGASEARAGRISQTLAAANSEEGREERSERPTEPPPTLQTEGLYMLTEANRHKP